VKDDDGNIIKQGYWNENKYKSHFHVNFLDTENAGPFDGPFDKPVVGTSKFYGFAKSSSPSTTVGAVDPLFVFCDDKGNDITNRTLYLSSDKRVVTLDDADPNSKLKNTDLADLGELTKDGEEPEDDEGAEGSGDKKDEDKNKSVLEKWWDYLKDFAMKVMSGDFGGIWDSAKEAGSTVLDKTKQIYDDFFGKYRNRSVSFRRSSKTYTGKISHEFLDYQNYIKNPGKIGLGPNNKLLTEDEWIDKVYDMTGSDPSALHLGEIVRGYETSGLKTADEVGGETKETMEGYTESVSGSGTTEGGSISGKEPVVNVTTTNSDILDQGSLNLTDALKQYDKYGKSPVEELKDNSDEQLAVMKQVRDQLQLKQNVDALIGTTVTGAVDQVARCVVENAVKQVTLNPSQQVVTENTTFNQNSLG
jgi:hypothetical protein